jgi:hypothetical protein
MQKYPTWSDLDVAEMLTMRALETPNLTQPVVELHLYDQLLLNGGGL